MLLLSSGSDIWQHAHSELSTTDVVPISTISPGFSCPPIRGTGVSRTVSTRQRFTFCSAEVIHTFIHFNRNLLTLSSLWDRRDRNPHLHQRRGWFSLFCWNVFWDIRLWLALWSGSFSNKARYYRYILTP